MATPTEIPPPANRYKAKMGSVLNRLGLTTDSLIVTTASRALEMLSDSTLSSQARAGYTAMLNAFRAPGEAAAKLKASVSDFRVTRGLTPLRTARSPGSEPA